MLGNRVKERETVNKMVTVAVFWGNTVLRNMCLH